MKLPIFLRRLLRWSGKALEASDNPDAETLRTLFAARYSAFKQLISANNKALEVMSEIEESLTGAAPFSMGYVRSQCSRTTASVFQIVRQLQSLGEGRYAALTPAFEGIRSELNALLAPPREEVDLPLLLSMDEIRLEHSPAVGGKMASLGELRNTLGLPTPDGFAATLAAYWKMLDSGDLRDEINRRIQVAEVERMDQLYGLSSSLRLLVVNAPVPEELANAIMERARAVEEASGGAVRWAVRSSALLEDAPGMSFAGQYRSLLGVCAEDLVDAYKEVLASQYSLEAMTYRLRNGLRDEDAAMCVGFLVMAPACCGGVAYSLDPSDQSTSGGNGVHVYAAWGLPKGIVDGATGADHYIAAPDNFLSKDVAFKENNYVTAPTGGVARAPVPEDLRDKPCLSDDRILELVERVRLLEKHFKAPQDVEWALRELPGQEPGFVFLQSRHLQAKALETENSDAFMPVAKDAPVLCKGRVTASRGAASGPLFKAVKHMDSLRFPDGAVLLVETAAPHWAPLLSRAAALVSVSGSQAGHLANVAREFGVPALFGVPKDCLNFHEGRVVTVHAQGLAVLDGRVEELLGAPKKPVNPMRGSPIFQSLEKASRLIVPLTLLDPESVTFRPENCRTFHDITRFCHEKAVLEMFNTGLGKEQKFSTKIAKQLVCGKSPMQFWVLDLDDGFIEEPQGKFVPLENIRSAPMLSIWKGMVAKPWAGPPAVDARGFLSVLVEATANPGLAPGMDNPYTNKNYFMVSRNFCNLQSRFGFHFCSVEALVGEHPAENYAGFVFKGGAADQDRRQRRARFVAELLEERGFRVDLRQDSLMARIEGGERDFMLQRLEALGFLIVHTRQLDMVMADEASVTYYRKELDEEIKRLLE